MLRLRIVPSERKTGPMSTTNMRMMTVMERKNPSLVVAETILELVGSTSVNRRGDG